MLSCLVVDDEVPAINLLSRYISDVPYLTLAASTTDAIEAVQILKTQKIDLVFLDIQMPKLTGLQVLDLFSNKLNVILTTAYSDYALEGFEKNVIDYLMKPIPFERFLRATEKALNVINRQQIAPVQEQATAEDFLFVKTEHKGKLRKVNLDEIAYIEGLRNYVSIYTDKRERIVTYIGISDLEERLPPNQFVRVHRSYIIPIKNILAVDGNEIILKDAPRIPTAGKFKDNLLQKFRRNLIQLKGDGSEADD
jgi:two-component system, LytTR family, response regulator